MSGVTNVCVKFILFSFNMILSVSKQIKITHVIINARPKIGGLLLTGFGAYWLFAGKSWNEITDGNFNAIFIAMVVVGLFLFLVSSLGCCGAAKGSSFMLLSVCMTEKFHQTLINSIIYSTH